MGTTPPDGGSGPFMEAEAQRDAALDARRTAFRARTEEYLRAGLDRLGAARFVARAAGTLSGPALDVGTGKGLLAIELARLGLDVLSVDVDAEEQTLAVLLARDAGVERRIQFRLGDARAIPRRDGHFGCAAMMDVLHHLEDPRPVLGEMTRCLRAGGTLVVADFSREGFEIVARVHRASGREHPESGVTLASARTVLLEQGFDLEAEIQAHCHEVLVLVKGSGCER